MGHCVNKNLPEVKELIDKLNINPLVALAKISIWQEQNSLDRFPTVDELQQPQEVNFVLKSIDILASDKAKQIFEKGKKANWDLNKILTELQIPKEQKQLILDLGITDREQIALGLASNYSYTVEINTGEAVIEKMKEVQTNVSQYYSPSEDRYYRYTEELGWISSDKDNKNQEHDVKTPEDLEPFKYNSEYVPVTEKIKSDYYSNLIVPGGTNYTENEIATPAITPSIKGHAQFSTDNGIGWFRSDDKILDKRQTKDPEFLEQEKKWRAGDISTDDINKWIDENFNDGTKTRRILEVQSDLFQKGRDRKGLTKDTSEIKQEPLPGEVGFFLETVVDKKNFNNTTSNQFLQLLNKDNNWVTFFIKFIIQDSAKKGYEKVLFPSGNTVVKIESAGNYTNIENAKEANEKNLVNTALFYENTITNIVKKQGYNSILITDEYGNTWNEITLNENRDNSTILMKKDLSEFESEENESIFSESVKEPSKVKEDNFEINKKLLFSNEKDTNRSFTAKEVLQNIIDFDLNLSDAGTNLVFKAMNILNLAKTRVKIISQEQFDKFTKNSEGEGTAVMAYNYDNGNVIYMTENSLKMFNKEQILESFIHEVAHNLSIKALINPVTFEEHEFHDLIFKAFEQYKHLGKTLNGSDSYGFTNEKEFVAELYSNAEFRKEIQNLDKRFWKNFVDGVRLLFGLSRTSANNELISSVLLIESVEKFIESNTTADENVFKNDYSNSFNNVLFKKIKDIKDADTYELETIDKKAEHLVNKAKSKVAELINRTKKSDKEKAGEFLEEFKKLEKELEHLSSLNKWKAITGYMVSFKSAIDKLNNLLENKFKVKEVTFNNVKYIKVKNLDAFKNEKGEFIIPEDQKSKVDKDFFETNNFIVDSNLYNDIENEGIKAFSNKDYLELANNYDEYLASYDLLEDIKKLIGDTVKDHTLSREDKLEIKEIKNQIIGLSEPHKELTDRIKDLRKDSAIKLFADPSNNKKVTTKWRSKLSLEYNKLKNPTQSRDEWIGYHMSNTHAEEIKKDLEDAARKIIENPYTDISSYVKNWMDLLNTNSPLINMMANIVGKMRDSILKEITNINFKIDKVFQEYSNFNNSLSMSKKYGNLFELNESEDAYYLKGKHSIKFKENYNKMLNSLLEKNKEVKDYDYKKDVEYKKWIKENTIKDELGQTIPHSKYLNKPLSPAEEKALDFFRTQTKNNHELNYKGRGGLYSTFFGAEYFKLPSKTKGDRERTLEGDIKGQIKDKWTDLKENKVDDINYGEAFDSKGGQLQRVKINFRGKLESKDQSLDLFTVYRAEEANAISFKHRSANENKLKLFLDIAKNKDYKTKSLVTRKWAMNIFAKEEVRGQTFSGEKSNEYAKIQGILETALYDITAYNEEALFGKMDANKLTSKVNNMAAFIGMTLNIGSGAVNFLNGQTMMLMLRIGGKYINKSNLSKAELNYTANLPKIMADISNPVKKSFHNQMLNMFDIIGGMNINKQDFLNNSTVKEMMSLHNANFINETVEHGLNCVLTEAVLRSIPVMNKNHKYIDKEGKETTEDKAASIFDMLYLDKDGILKTKDYFTYSKYNLVDDYHKTGKQSINYLLKKNVENLYGVYDSNMKAEISKHWYGKILMLFKNFFLSQMEYRYKGITTSKKSKDELDDEDLTFNNAEQEFTEGIYTTAIRTFYPLLRHLNLQMVKENFQNLSDYEKANLKQVFFEVSMTAILLPLLGAMMAANAGDDDDELYFLLFAFRRLESEMSQFRNIAELNRMISNPIAANRFLQNGFTVVNDIFSPINFTPKGNESYFDWLSENNKNENIMLNHAFKLAPGKSLFMNTYKQRYSLINK